MIQGDWAFPPYEYLNEKGQPDGFNVELTRAVMKELGYSYEIKLSDWNSVMKSLRTGKIDLVMGMMYSNKRARVFRFGPIHGYVYQDVVYRKNSTPIRTFDQLKDKSSCQSFVFIGVTLAVNSKPRRVISSSTLM